MTATDDPTVTHPVPRDVEAAWMNSGRVHGAVPIARKLAKEHDIELRELTGSGTQGRIVVKDVQAAIDARDATSAEAPEIGQRSKVASNAQESAATVNIRGV